MTKLIVWVFLVSIGYVTLIKDSCFGAETWLITQNLKPEKGCGIEKLSFSSSKENGSIVISKDGCGKCLRTINMCLFWISLTMLTLSADCYCGTHSLRQPCFAKGHGYFTKVLSFYMKIPGVITPNWKAVYGCTSDRLWINPNLVLDVLSLTESFRSTWLTNDCNRCLCEAGYHLLATDTLYHGM